MKHPQSLEHQRLQDSEERRADWKHWGPYLADRAWGTVREDYGDQADPWHHFPHHQARSRAFRWNEDGLGGFCNRLQNICLGWAFWNGQDPILKERLFGLAGPEGNHGEDVKELYYYEDGTPTHSYMRMRYRYPQVAFPYADLVDENRKRSRDEPEYELTESLAESLAAGRFFDIQIEWAKRGQEDLFGRVTVINHAEEPAPIWILPHVWFRNTWSWKRSEDQPPRLYGLPARGELLTAKLQSEHLGNRHWYAHAADTASPAQLLVTENETDPEVFGQARAEGGLYKNAFHRRLIDGEVNAANEQGEGSKSCGVFERTLAPQESWSAAVRLTPDADEEPFATADATFTDRRQEADAYYESIQPTTLSAERRRLQREAWAGLLWSKQFYHYSVSLWQEGETNVPTVKAPPRRRNKGWEHLYNLDVLSMPDAWEYPWFAAWDLAFHAIPLVMVDPEWAKRQMILMLREWYMHPNGQLAAYEWSFSDTNPPVHAWAAWRIYKMDAKRSGKLDTDFLERVFHKLLLNFTWWVNRKDRSANNIFEGGFLGLDNIGVFDRSQPLPGGGYLEQSDGTAWMGMYSLNMLVIALELAKTRPTYEDVATKFFEHFIYIANAINGPKGLWHEEDGFYYDRLCSPSGTSLPLQVRSFVGLTPLFACETLDEEQLEALPRFKRRLDWFVKYRPELVERVASLTRTGQKGRRLLSLVEEDRLKRILPRMFDPGQFLSPFGLRSLSKEHEKQPYRLSLPEIEQEVAYNPAESRTAMYGGNSNWRGPIWFPLNYLMIESLQKLDHYYGDRISVSLGESGKTVNLSGAADEIAERLIRIFEHSEKGARAVHGSESLYRHDPRWKDLILFYEYFHGDSGAGLGASHQTGWTALVAKLIEQCAPR